MLQGLVHQAGIPAPAAVATPHVALAKMGLQDDLKAFLELYERLAVVSGWPKGQWTACLLPFLTDKAQLVSTSIH